ncbi:hypothetical protein AAHH86_00145 [Candidatus Hodgkinia cicadicola]
MYTKSNNVLINQNSTSCQLVLNLIRLSLASKQQRARAEHKLLSQSGKFYHSKHNFKLELGNQVVAAAAASQTERGNVASKTWYVVNYATGDTKSKIVSLKGITTCKKSNLVTAAISTGCKAKLNEFKASALALEHKTVCVSAVNGCSIGRQVASALCCSKLGTLILSSKTKTTPFSSTTWVSAATVGAVMASLAGSEPNTSLPSSVSTLLLAIMWCNQRKLTLELGGRKLAKLLANSTLNSQTCSHDSKASKPKVFLEAGGLALAHKLRTNVVAEPRAAGKRIQAKSCSF